jgi:hypothetical protein
MSCRCGFTTDRTKMCDGTHKVVRAVREKVAEDVTSWLSKREVYDDNDLIQFIKTGREIDTES